jgi:hypothetical protein
MISKREAVAWPAAELIWRRSTSGREVTRRPTLAWKVLLSCESPTRSPTSSRARICASTSSGSDSRRDNVGWVASGDLGDLGDFGALGE